MRRTRYLFLCAVVLGSACIPRTGPSGGGVAALAQGSTADTPCPADAVIDDAEDNNNQVSPGKGRSGYWYTFADKAGSTTTPRTGDQGGTFTMAPGGANGSAQAAHATGKVGAGQVVYAGMAFNFVDPKGPYDASAYQGIAFYAKAGPGATKVRVKVPDINTDPDGKTCKECFNDFGMDIELTSEWKRYAIPWSAMTQLTGWGSPRPAAIDPSKLFGVQWQFNTAGAAFDLWVDDVQFIGCASHQEGPPALAAPGGVAPASGGGGAALVSGGGHDLLKNSTFEDGTSLPWTTSFSAPAGGKAEVQNQALCLRIDSKGSNAWDAQVRHREMVIRQGHTYTVQFKAYATAPTKMRPKVGMAGPPYPEYWSSTISVDTTPRLYVGRFTMNQADDRTAELAFHMGGSLATPSQPFTVCIDDVHLEDPAYSAPAPIVRAPVPRVRVNQMGYFPSLGKHGMAQNPASAPLGWELLGAGGAVLAKGSTTVFGQDAASGEHVHIADFSSVNKPGEGLKLRIGSDESYPFTIGKGLYSKLKTDALGYFYHNRSGIAITMPYAGEARWARPIGHEGDKSVPCAPGSGCSYSLDVSGGWYDAGDHGKYVVNGGIAVWTLLNEYERGKILGTSSGDFGDGKLNIPENKNGAPDILDEARWELEFLLKMQVPAGNPLSGMAHHKVHDEKWTALGMAPHEDTMKRYLHAPSTAATLNLSAVAAQAARIWKAIDPAFSARCLSAAERAWAAAVAHPAVYAPGSDNTGGGPYDDTNVNDEFYWASAELFITTGKDAYRSFMTKSAYFEAIPSSVNGGGDDIVSAMTWQATAALGTISLAVVPSGLDAGAVKTSRANIAAAADAYLAAIEGQGYRLPLKPGSTGKLPWGSNSFVLNNAIVLGLAHDFTQQPKYLNGVVEAMDYIVGKNPLAQSYVTGYGQNPLKNPHHRFWAHQINERFPAAPPGAVSGGPNSGLEDPYVQAAGLAGCAPERCFVDHMEAWSANEITINWNAPLAWVAAYLDEKGR